MPNLVAPVKTPLGLDELRHRTRGLGQRYRTVLLLVDGRRPLGEVLGMAHRAGAQTSHFEELVRMGLVEVPIEASAPEPIETIPGALDTPRLTSVEVEVLGEAALTPMGELLPEPEQEPEREAEVDAFAEAAALPLAARQKPAAPKTEDEIDAEPVAKFTQVDMGELQALPAVEVSAISPPTLPSPHVARRSPPPPPLARYQEPPLSITDTPRAPDWTHQVRETPFKVADHARAAPRMTEEQRLQYVRDLLLDTLRRDSLLFSTFSVGRVRGGVTQRDLIKLVWEIERDRAHTRRTRDQLLNLQRARELLGMGNTLVAGDSQPDASTSEY